MSIATLVEIYKMKELSKSARISLIKKLGCAINNEYAMNITDEVVAELVQLIERETEIADKAKENEK